MALDGLTGMTGLSAVMSTAAINLDVLWNPVRISDIFNAIGITHDGDVYETGGLDGTPSVTLSSTQLGIQVIFDDIDFVFGEVDTPATDNIIICDGQVLNLPNNRCDKFYFLGFGIGGGATNTFVVNYEDGDENVVLSISDWMIPDNHPFEEIAFTMSSANEPNGTSTSGSFYVYAYEIDIDRTRILNSITLPADSRIIILAASQASEVANLGLFLQASDLNRGEGEKIREWSDSAHQITFDTISASGPIFRKNRINGYPTLKFDGNECMQGSLRVPNRRNYSSFIVFRENTTATFTIALSWGSGGNGTLWQGYEPENRDNGLTVAADSTNDITSGTALGDNDWHIAEAIHVGSSLTGYDTGTLVGTTSLSNYPLTANTVTIGGYTEANNIPFIGEITEVLLFNTNLSDLTRQVVEQYLLAKYFTAPAVIQSRLETEDELFYLGYEQAEIETEDLGFLVGTEDIETWNGGLTVTSFVDGTDGDTPTAATATLQVVPGDYLPNGGSVNIAEVIVPFNQVITTLGSTGWTTADGLSVLDLATNAANESGPIVISFIQSNLGSGQSFLLGSETVTMYSHIILGYALCALETEA